MTYGKRVSKRSSYRRNNTVRGKRSKPIAAYKAYSKKRVYKSKKKYSRRK